MFVYLIAEPGASLVKIGRAKNVANRLAGLRTGSPVELAVRAHWVGTEDDEKNLHRVFADKRVRGEWFEFGQDDPVQAIRDALGRDPAPSGSYTSAACEATPPPERRARRKVDALPSQEDLDGQLNVYRTGTGQVVSEYICMKTCVGLAMAWGPGHKHEFVMSEEQYEEFGPFGPVLGEAAAP